MKKRSFIASFLAGVALLAVFLPAVSADTPSIVSVSAPPDSSDLYAWAFDTGIYSIAFPIKDPEHIGIGYIVEPEPFHRTWSPMTDFVMHDHMYVAPGEPDPRRANITYRFDAPAKISDPCCHAVKFLWRWRQMPSEASPQTHKACILKIT